MTLRTIATALALTLASPALATPQQLVDSVRAELNSWGMQDVSIDGLSRHKLSTISHILHSGSTPSAMRGKIMAIIDPERHSIRGLFK